MGKSLNESRLDSLFSVMSEELHDVERQDRSDETLYACNRLAIRMRKRAGYRNPVLRPRTIDSFIAVNTQVRDSRVALSETRVANARYFLTRVLENVTTRFNDDNLQETLDHRVLFDLWRFGPGAANGVTGSHAAEKIQQPMTCTQECAPLVVKLRNGNVYFSGFDCRTGSKGFTLVSGSRLTTVPKNQDTERTIAIEPSGNMALQLAAGSYLEEALRSIGLDIRSQQPKNKLMAHRGSVDGSVATVDLKSASDMISLDLVRRLMPAKWVKLLETVRSSHIEVPGYGLVELHMMSTMGNGFTFPLMTLLLVSLIYAMRCEKGGPNLWIDWSHTCVFGDDIIVPTREYASLCEILREAGFVVNTDKSYSEGPFRESCGGDYYKGVDVTPFYVRSLSDDRMVYTAINQVFEWCARHDVLLHRTLALLRSYIRGKVHLVPEWHNPNEGVLTAGCPRRYTYLHTVIDQKVLTDSWFAVMLACGGYLESGDGTSPNSRSTQESNESLRYTPRPFKTGVRVRQSRVPKGFLDGSDRIKRSKATSDYIEIHDFIVAQPCLPQTR